VVVVAELLEMGADPVWDLEGVQRRIGSEEAAVVSGDVQAGVAFVNGAEEAAVVGGDVQAGVAFVNGAEEAAEVVPERVRVVGVAVLEGVLEGFGGQQAAVLAKGAEQDAVQQFLGAAQDFGRGDGGVLAAQAGEDPLADVGVEGVELVGEGAPDSFRSAEEFVGA
jgi:TctA family transporter